jgi:hypothetical protein
MWHHKDDPQLFPDSARGALRTTRHGGSSITGEAAGVGVMISRTPRVTVRDREVGRDVVSRDARANGGQGGVRAYLGGVESTCSIVHYQIFAFSCVFRRQLVTHVFYLFRVSLRSAVPALRHMAAPA